MKQAISTAQKYLVLSHDSGEPTQAMLMTANEIIREIDMFDAYEPNFYEVYDVSGYAPVKLKIHGKWHCDDVQYIKLTDALDHIIFDGHGTEH